AFLDVSRVVRHWIDTDVLDHDHRCAALDNTEEDVVRVGPLIRDVEPETVAIEPQCCGNILHDEERRDAGDGGFSHVSFSTVGFFRSSILDWRAAGDFPHTTKCRDLVSQMH